MCVMQSSVAVGEEMVDIKDVHPTRAIGVCGLIDINSSVNSAGNVISPLDSAYAYFAGIEHRSMKEGGKVTLLQDAKHGSLKVTPTGNYRYFAAQGYVGFDSATFLVELGSLRVKVIYSIHVMNGVPDASDSWDPYQDKKYCPKGEMWKVSLSDVDAASSLAGFVSPTSLLNYQLQQVDISLNFANLTNGAFGETIAHNITLDDDGNGYGWFIDSTPELNDELLPTSNPNEWIAKPGSEALASMLTISAL